MSFRLKTIIGIGLIESILLVILIVTSLNLLETTKENELIKQANSTALLFATTTKDAVIAMDLAALDSFVQEVMKNPSLVYARVLSEQVGLLTEQSKLMGTPPEFIQDHRIDQVEDRVFDTFADIIESDVIYGRVELGFSIADIEVLMAQARRKTFMIALVELFLSALFSFALGFYLTRQLSELKQASRKITQGELGFQLEVKGHDELAETARAFNQMSSALSDMWYARDLAQRELEALNVALEEKVVERTQQLEEAQQQALEGAHRAGMADVAAGALHNIGNLINSAKTSTTLLFEQVQQSKLKKLQKANVLLKEKLDDIQGFYNDEKSKPLLEYYITLGEALQDEQSSFRSQLSDIQESIELTAQTIREQQAYAKNPLRFESQVDLIELIEDVLSLAKRRMDALDIVVERHYPDTIPGLYTQKNKLHQVIFNLIINAVDAIELSDQMKTNQMQGKLVISLTVDESVKHDELIKHIVLAVQDNGCGIETGMLKEIFHYGVTTKASGNGAGLHSSANLMTEMQGEISVDSQGLGKGATFTVRLPIGD